jgi:hypothetical protein
MATAPNINNYQIPTGKVFFKPTGGTFRDLGNCVSFTISSTLTKKEHFRNYGGRRTKDKTIITQVQATAKFVLDEINADNLAFFALGTPVQNSDDSYSISGLSNTNFTGTMRVIGDNQVGPLVHWEGDVSFNPAGDFSLLKDNDDFNQINCEADVQADANNNFGTWTVTDQ